MKTELWQRLLAARRRADKTQADIAAACVVELGKNLTRNAVALWESTNPKTRTTPDLAQLKVVAKETGTDLMWLVMDGESLDPEPISTPAPEIDYAAALVVRRIPIRGAPMFEQDGYWAFSAPGNGAYVEWPAYNNDVYAIEISTDRFYPEVRNGVLMLFSPSKQPVFGEYVLLQRKDGRSSIFEFLQADDRQVSVSEIGAQRRVTIDRDQIQSIHAWVGTAPASIKRSD